MDKPGYRIDSNPAEDSLSGLSVEMHELLNSCFDMMATSRDDFWNPPPTSGAGPMLFSHRGREKHRGRRRSIRAYEQSCHMVLIVDIQGGGVGYMEVEILQPWAQKWWLPP